MDTSNLQKLTAFTATFLVGVFSYSSNSAAALTACEQACHLAFERCVKEAGGIAELHCVLGVENCLLFCPKPPPPPPPGGDVLSQPKLMFKHARVNVPVTGLIATFRDSNPSALVSDFTAVIDWGDGTQSDGVVSSSSPGVLDVSVPTGGHAYATVENVTVSVSLSAPGVTAAAATGVVKVGRHK